MYLKTDHHEFFVKHERFDDVHYYSIGNNNLRPRACVVISVMNANGKCIMAIQDLEYYSTCSSRTLERKTGTVEMLQGSIKAILKRHPKVSIIELNDKSFFTLKNGDHIPLPEYRLLVKGKTWYEEYFGALPAYEGLERIVHAYKEVEVSIEPSELTRKKFKNLLKSLHLRDVSGNGWIIPITSIRNYKTKGVFKEGNIMSGGGDGWIFENMTPIDHTFRIYAKN